MSSSAIVYDAQDLDVAARTVYGEARNQSVQGQVAVLWVIRHRAERRWGSPYTGKVGAIKHVCLLPMQFSCWNENDPNRNVIIGLRPERLRMQLELARSVFDGSIVDPTDGADHYFTVARPPGTSTWPPSWASKMRHTKVIGDHTFYKE